MARRHDNGERVTLKLLYDTLKDYPTRREFYAAAALLSLGNQVFAAASSAETTRAEAVGLAVVNAARHLVINPPL